MSDTVDLRGLTKEHQALVHSLVEALAPFSSITPRPPSSYSGAPAATYTPPPANTGAEQLGKCPRCKTGNVIRKVRNDGDSHLQCSEQRYPDPEKVSCQWKAWSADDQAAYFKDPTGWRANPAGPKTWQKKPYASGAQRTTQVAQPAPNKRVHVANKIIEALNKVPDKRRHEILGKHGYKAGTTFVLFVNGLDDDARREVIKELA